MKLPIYQIEAESQEEAWDKIFTDGHLDDIEELMLKENIKTIKIEYGYYKTFSYKGNDDCEWEELGSFEVEDTELDIEWFHLAQLYREKFIEMEQKYSSFVKRVAEEKRSKNV